MLIDQSGQQKGLLKMGEHKSIQTDRVILVPGRGRTSASRKTTDCIWTSTALRIWKTCCTWRNESR
jgi:hypothetical protein